jgi:hypothetical protein
MMQRAMIRMLGGLIALTLFWGSAGAAKADFIATATLLGKNENPPNASPGTGFIQVDFSNAKPNQLHVHEVFSGLEKPATAAHIHIAPVGLNGPVVLPFSAASGFPTGSSSGVYDAILTDKDINTASGFTFAQLIAAIEAGNAYANIHTAVFPGGEIRGQLVAQTVPEPASLMLASLGTLGLIACLGRKRLVNHP